MECKLADSGTSVASLNRMLRCRGSLNTEVTQGPPWATGQKDLGLGSLSFLHGFGQAILSRPHSPTYKIGTAVTFSHWRVAGMKIRHFVH